MELNLRKEFGFLEGFADLLGTEVKNGLLVIPNDKGKGYLRGLRLDNSINVIISNRFWLIFSIFNCYFKRSFEGFFF